jgi:hypothetical protein
VIESFMWGYWGWGGSTKELVLAFDAAERERGHEPPVFVDVRIGREVRAVGFRGDAFEKRLGETRYRWLPDLGNQGILDRGEVRLRDASKASDLLDLVVQVHADRRRVIFFCACQSPPRNEQRACHRLLVGDVLLEEARRRKVDLSVVEWPGGAPCALFETVSPPAVRAALGGGRSVPVPPGMSPSIAVALPWGSYALVEGEAASIVVGPALHAQGRWALQVPWAMPAASTETQLLRAIGRLRKGAGLEPRFSLTSTRVRTRTVKA